MGWRWLVAACLALAASCAARRVIPPAYPAYGRTLADFSDVTLYVREFRINGAPGEEEDDLEALHAMRAAFIDYLAHQAQFRGTVAELAPGEHPPEPALIADIVIDADHSSFRTWLLDAAAVWPFPLVFPLTPQWGEAHVQLSISTFASAGRPVWQDEATADVPYLMLLYSWYRTAPVEDAYREAYGEAFADVARRFAQGRDSITAKLKKAVPRGGAAAGREPLSRKSNPAAPRPKVAVLPVQLDTSAEGRVPKLFDDYLLSAVQNAGALEVIGQEDINALLGFERQRELFGCDDSACIAEIGGALGVELIVSVQVAFLKGDWVLTAKLIDAEHMKVRGRVSEMVGGDAKTLLQAMPGITAQLFERAGL